MFSKGVEQIKQGQNAEAVETFRQANRVEPTVAEGHFNLGLALYKLKRYGEAAVSFG